MDTLRRISNNQSIHIKVFFPKIVNEIAELNFDVYKNENNIRTDVGIKFLWNLFKRKLVLVYNKNKEKEEFTDFLMRLE